jgi:hypothetical protein
MRDNASTPGGGSGAPALAMQVDAEAADVGAQPRVHGGAVLERAHGVRRQRAEHRLDDVVAVERRFAAERHHAAVDAGAGWGAGHQQQVGGAEPAHFDEPVLELGRRRRRQRRAWHRPLAKRVQLVDGVIEVGHRIAVSARSAQNLTSIGDHWHEIRAIGARHHPGTDATALSASAAAPYALWPPQ